VKKKTTCKTNLGYFSGRYTEVARVQVVRLGGGRATPALSPFPTPLHGLKASYRHILENNDPRKISGQFESV
jgi:hypothetical protein